MLVTSRSDSYFERSHTSFSENESDDIDLNSNGLDDKVRKNGEKIIWFSADCVVSLDYCIFLFADELRQKEIEFERENESLRQQLQQQSSTLTQLQELTSMLQESHR